jgi:hypothetical protein
VGRELVERSALDRRSGLFEVREQALAGAGRSEAAEVEERVRGRRLLEQLECPAHLGAARLGLGDALRLGEGGAGRLP